MKCPNCGKWNQASLPHCFSCGEPLAKDGLLSSAPESPAWRDELKDRERAKAYLRVDDEGEIESASDPRDVLAMEMVDLKARKLQGEIQQRRLRKSAAERGLAPSGLTVRTTSNRGTFFSAYDNPDATLRPVDPELIEEGEVDEKAQIVYTEKYRPRGMPPKTKGSAYDYGFTQRVMNTDEPVEDQPVYDGYHDTSAYIPSQSRQDEYEHSLRMRTSGSWPSRRLSMRKLIRNVLVLATVLVVGFIGWKVVLPMLDNSGSVAVAEVTVTPTIRDDLAAHTITIPGEDGQRITIRELRTSAIVTGGVATFNVLDHIWYDNFEDYLQEVMTVTLTPYLMTETGKQQQLKAIHYDIDIPLSPIELNTPDAPYKIVSTAMYSIVFYVREGSNVTINGQDYSDLVNTEGGKVSYNATVQPIGENRYEIVVSSQYCRENSMTITLFREKQDIPLDLASDIASRSTDDVLTIRATTLPGAVVKVLSKHSDLNITNTAMDGSFSFKALFDHIGDNTVTITADYPGKKTTTVEHIVYYVPSIDIYSRKAWHIVRDYNDLINNLEQRKKDTQIYVCEGVITSIETTKPQRAFVTCGTEGSSVVIYVENSSRTTWVEGTTYTLYADAYGMYDNKPWLIARYTMSVGEQ